MDKHIQYSLCWEDPKILLEALKITKKDQVLSIASGGENVFAILLQDPLRIVAIDDNKYQTYLLKLKIAAIKSLEYEEFIAFLGFRNSNERFKLFNICKTHLSNEETNFWASNSHNLNSGIAHIGKFEYYLNMFRKFVLPFVLSKDQIRYYLNLDSTKKQMTFFEEEWNNWRWKLLFKIFFSKTVMQLFGRKKEYFTYNKKHDIATHYYIKSKYGFTEMPVKDNFFVHYILTGIIPTPFKGHPYLDKSNFHKLKKLINKIEIVNDDLTNYLKKLKNGGFSKYNLSNVFEFMSQKRYEQTLQDIIRISNKRSILCYWNNLVPRYQHRNLKKIITNKELSQRLFERDRVFFYSRLMVETVK